MVTDRVESIRLATAGMMEGVQWLASRGRLNEDRALAYTRCMDVISAKQWGRDPSSGVCSVVKEALLSQFKRASLNGALSSVVPRCKGPLRDPLQDIARLLARDESACYLTIELKGGNESIFCSSRMESLFIARHELGAAVEETGLCAPHLWGSICNSHSTVVLPKTLMCAMLDHDAPTRRGDLVIKCITRSGNLIRCLASVGAALGYDHGGGLTVALRLWPLESRSFGIHHGALVYHEIQMLAQSPRVSSYVITKPSVSAFPPPGAAIADETYHEEQYATLRSWYPVMPQVDGGTASFMRPADRRGSVWGGGDYDSVDGGGTSAGGGTAGGDGDDGRDRHYISPALAPMPVFDVPCNGPPGLYGPLIHGAIHMRPSSWMHPPPPPHATAPEIDHSGNRGVSGAMEVVDDPVNPTGRSYTHTEGQQGMEDSYAVAATQAHSHSRTHAPIESSYGPVGPSSAREMEAGGGGGSGDGDNRGCAVVGLPPTNTETFHGAAAVSSEVQPPSGVNPVSSSSSSNNDSSSSGSDNNDRLSRPASAAAHTPCHMFHPPTQQPTQGPPPPHIDASVHDSLDTSNSNPQLLRRKRPRSPNDHATTYASPPLQPYTASFTMPAQTKWYISPQLQQGLPSPPWSPSCGVDAPRRTDDACGGGPPIGGEGCGVGRGGRGWWEGRGGDDDGWGGQASMTAGTAAVWGDEATRSDDESARSIREQGLSSLRKRARGGEDDDEGILLLSAMRIAQTSL